MLLLNALFLGLLSILAGASFLLPNKMGTIYKAPIALLCIALGALYVYLAYVPMSESDKAPIIRAILAAIVLCILASNVGAYVVERLGRRAAKKAGLHPFGRRRDDQH